MTDFKCEIVPYTECEMKMQATPYRSFREFERVYHKHSCITNYEHVYHEKMFPECKNVTRQNCVTKWETDANGKQVEHSFGILLSELINLLAAAELRFNYSII